VDRRRCQQGAEAGEDGASTGPIGRVVQRRGDQLSVPAQGLLFGGTSSREAPVVTEPDAPPGPYGLRPDEGDAYWFLDFLTTFKASTKTTGGGFALVERLTALAAAHGIEILGPPGIPAN
jgi:hypothetical protein